MSQRKISRLLGVTLRATRNGALNRELFLTDARAYLSHGKLELIAFKISKWQFIIVAMM